MKILSLFALVLLVGCGPMPTMEELEHQALLTGDWTAVEKREQMLLRRKSAAAAQCPAGYVRVCQDRSSLERCGCAERDVMFSILAGR